MVKPSGGRVLEYCLEVCEPEQTLVDRCKHHGSSTIYVSWPSYTSTSPHARRRLRLSLEAAPAYKAVMVKENTASS